jgi:pre-mRNA-splicing factor ATP-dependent RNA helicase DHX16
MKQEEGEKKKSVARARQTSVKADIDAEEIDENVALDARELDQKLKQEFAERLKRRDDENTKKVMVTGLSKADEEELRRRKEASEKEGHERKQTVDQLREYSRVEYLKQRYEASARCSS